MDTQPFDQSHDPLLAFAPEATVVPPVDREPAFLRTPTPYDGHLSITSVAEQAPSQTDRGGPVTTVLVIAGVLAGFAGGYVFADRIIAPVAPAQRVTAPPPTPAAAQAPAPVVAPIASSESPAPRTEPSTEPLRESNVVKAAQATDTSAAPAASAPSTTRRASAPSTTARRSTTPRPQPAIAPVTVHDGAIEIMSRPRDAQVFLDGTLVGRAPMSIPNVPEGMHQVRVELDGFSPWVASVRVKGGSRARIGASLEHE
jgi:PEGA domain-containing protein